MAVKMREYLAALMCVTGAIHLGGCGSQPTWLSINPDDWSTRSEENEPIVLDVSGPVAIDVESFAGDVEIEADNRLKRATVKIVREASHGEGRAGDAKASLADITASAEVVPGEVGHVIQVRAASTNPESHLQHAIIRIQAPDIEGVRIRTIDGAVTVRNIRGKVEIMTTNHDVRVMTNQAMTEPVTIVNNKGDIDFRVRGESAGKLDCQTIDGKVTNRQQYGRLVVHDGTDDDSLHATLNDGKNPIVLRTVDGDIRVAVVHNPEKVGHLIFD